MKVGFKIGKFTYDEYYLSTLGESRIGRLSTKKEPPGKRSINSIKSF